MYDNLAGAVVGLLLIGGLPLVVAGALALAIFNRAVARHMVAANWRPSVPSPGSAHQPRRPAATPLNIRVVNGAAASGSIDPSAPVLRQLAAAHAGAGLVFGVTGAVLLLLFSGLELLPLRLSVVALSIASPTVIALCILVGPDWRLRAQIVLGYGVLIVVLGAFSWAVGTPELSLGATGEMSQAASTAVTLPGFVQPALIGAIYILPTLALFLLLARRAAGIVMLLFFVVMVQVIVVFPSLLAIPAMTSIAVEIALAVGVGAGTVFWSFMALGLLAGAWVGWRAALFVVHLFATKRISDLRLIIGAIWLLQTLVLASSLEGESPGLGWAAAFLPMVAWAITLYGGQRILAAQSTERSARHLLLLRVFGFGRRSRRLVDLLGSRWRLLGSIHLIAAPDIAAWTVDPSTFMAFVRGRLRQIFLRTPDDLKQRLQSLDRLPNLDGRFRMNQFYCSGEIWKTAVTRLMEDACLIAMDLRGFGPERRGCVFELQTLLDKVPLGKLVLIIDRTTDVAALETLLQERWQDLDAASPNHVLGPAELRLLDTGAGDTAAVRSLLTFVEPQQDIRGEPAAALPIR